MIDLHAHILHGIDDGPSTLEESLEMCRIAREDGITTIIATPHIFNGIYNPDWETILLRVRDLKERLDSSAGQPRSALQVVPGADVHFSAEIMNLVEKKAAGTINGQGKFMMIEFPHREVPVRAEDLLFRLLAKGTTPIISHPERNLEIAEKPKRYYQMIRMGCLGQVTAMSLTNGFGSGVRRFAEKLLSHRLVHFIASDAHGTDVRQPMLSPAVREAAMVVRKEEALRMVSEYPQAVLEGRRPKIPEPIPI